MSEFLFLFFAYSNRRTKRAGKGYGLLMAYSIMIDPGHGGNDPGAVYKRAAGKRTTILPLAMEVGKILEENGG